MKRQKKIRILPNIGTVLNGKFKGKPYKARIVKDNKVLSGKAINYNGIKYYSMTSAAQAITKQPTNGWRFWKF